MEQSRRCAVGYLFRTRLLGEHEGYRMWKGRMNLHQRINITAAPRLGREGWGELTRAYQPIRHPKDACDVSRLLGGYVVGPAISVQLPDVVSGQQRSTEIILFASNHIPPRDVPPVTTPKSRAVNGSRCESILGTPSSKKSTS